jgi:asparagine synthetase B (glutamine-hydrolysing)
MCGIHVQVGPCHDASDSATLAESTNSEAWPLWRRRGPDHHGHVRMIVPMLYTEPTGCIDVTPSSCRQPVEGSSSFSIQLQSIFSDSNQRVISVEASVLSMRQSLTTQPIPLYSRSLSDISEPISCNASNESHINVSNNQQQNAYFLWNGEIYHMLSSSSFQDSESVPDSHDEPLQDWMDVSSPTIADTRLVADQVQEVLRQHYTDQAQYHRPKDDTTIDAPVSSHDLLLHRLSRLCQSWINAEFAFCLVTPTALYYGKDGWGRRSLLTRSAPCTLAGENDCEPANVSHGTWTLSSVATTTDSTFTWEEVEPGRVYVYHVDAHTTTAGPRWWWPVPTPLPSDSSLTLSSTTSPIRSSHNQPSTIPSWESASDQLTHLLREAVRVRITGHHSVSLLFSGGLDSVVLAALVLHCFPAQSDPSSLHPYTLHLINVHFVPDSPTSNNPVAADTLAAEASMKDLQQVFPCHSIRLIRQQVTYSELQPYTAHISQLMAPSDSVMDHNIATALWWAAKATPDRVVLTGVGADEQLGGYRRHLLAYQQQQQTPQESNWLALRRELDLDQDRLWLRNTGRDDRILSDHGKEGRYPYLDRHVTDYLRSLPLERVVEFDTASSSSMSSSIMDRVHYSHLPGDKRLLRIVAARLGLPAASMAMKRAIQFGSRLSHVCDKERYGSRRQATRKGKK